MGPKRRRVVILGSGFGGLAAAEALRGADLDITLIDRTNHHLFQPLLYQVATAALSPGDIAWPLRTIFRSQSNVRVVMGEVRAIDRAGRRVQVTDHPPIPYDVLIVAVGSRHAYFNRPDWEGYAPGLKTLADAVALRARMVLAFEQAERRAATSSGATPLTFVIVGGGPTGVELAGAMAEIGRNAMLPDFPFLQRQAVRILLVEAGSRVLSGFPPDLSAHAQSALESMGVTVLLNQRVREVGPKGVTLDGQFIETGNVIWAAGNRASPLLSSLQVPLDKDGRVFVRPDLTVPDDDWLFVIGDAAAVQDGQGHFLPGLAPVAMQEGRYVAAVLAAPTATGKRAAFRYVDRGTLATIGRAKAVAQFGSVHVSGFWAWMLWCTVHIFFLIGFRNRFRVVSEWIWYYLTFKPGARLLDQSHN
ncbi:MAG: NAD(P)-binding protein [Nitrospira sp. CR1.2]|nr:NAD(P)-binding protein [Nitrospira sp. CR1.2]